MKARKIRNSIQYMRLSGLLLGILPLRVESWLIVGYSWSWKRKLFVRSKGWS
jgi:hypothetical protein